MSAFVERNTYERGRSVPLPREAAAQIACVDATRGARVVAACGALGHDAAAPQLTIAMVTNGRPADFQAAGGFAMLLAIAQSGRGFVLVSPSQDRKAP